jgi:hypothetical protein
MSQQEEFKQAIEQGNLQEALLIAFSNNIELKITTSLVFPNHNECYSWQSNLNLLEGLETEISDKLLEEEFKNFRYFHCQQIEQAYKTWDKNRETLVRIIKILAGIPRKYPETEIESEKKSLALEIPDLKLSEENLNITSEISPTIEIKESQNKPNKDWDLQINTHTILLEEKKDSQDLDDDISKFKSSEQESAEIADNLESESLKPELPNLDSSDLLPKQIINSGFQEFPVQEMNQVEQQLAEEENWDDDLVSGMDSNPEVSTKQDNNSVSKENFEIDDDWGDWLDEDDLSSPRLEVKD